MSEWIVGDDCLSCKFIFEYVNDWMLSGLNFIAS